MKKVLVIADEFPPVGGAGVQRTLKFTKYLQQNGYMPYIFTRDSDNILLKDETLLKEIPDNVIIYRTKAYDYQSKKDLLHKILYYKLLIPDGRIIWALKSRKALLKKIDEIKPDIVYSTSFPYSDHILALYAKRKNNQIKWVADFRDEWTNNPYFKYNKIRMAIEKSLEKRILKNADALITNTPIMKDNFNKTYPFTKNKFTVIPNGFDKSDYTDLMHLDKNTDTFTITYTGSLYGSRKPDIFFEALSNVVKEKSNICVIFIGNIKKEQFNKTVEKYHLEKHVKLISYLPHKECIATLKNGDASLLIEGKDNIPFYTGKVFEYMFLSNPILAVIPEKGAASALIKKTRTGIVCDCESIKDTEQAITKLYNDWIDKKPSNLRNEEEIKKYDRQYLTKQLTDLFNHIL